MFKAGFYGFKQACTEIWRQAPQNKNTSFLFGPEWVWTIIVYREKKILTGNCLILKVKKYGLDTVYKRYGLKWYWLEVKWISVQILSKMDDLSFYYSVSVKSVSFFILISWVTFYRCSFPCTWIDAFLHTLFVKARMINQLTNLPS